MIASYIKTSIRSLARTKLFSVINIAGLAIGMSVGLLLIAFLHDLLSYDRFHANGDYVYRITSDVIFQQGYTDEFATASLRAADLIRDHVTGIKELSMIRTEFAVDAKIEERVIPLTGLYADPAFLRIFSFRLTKGDLSTALKEPRSIVLTERTAEKLFGKEEALGKNIQVDSSIYVVTGIMEDPPFFSHLRFESLVSLSTIKDTFESDPALNRWESAWQRNYIYVQLDRKSNKADIQGQINRISAGENRKDAEAQVNLKLLPLYDIAVGRRLANSIGPVMPVIILWVVAGLAVIILLSACFNYTNLSLARAIRRYKEIGLRKVIGASRNQIKNQFLVEALFVSVAALVLSFGMFLLLRPYVMTLSPELEQMVKLEITSGMVFSFIALTIGVGIFAGLLPAIVFAEVPIMRALKNPDALEILKGFSLRRILVVLQYTITLIFITSTSVGYIQYNDILKFDLGFSTQDILNIGLQKNKPDELVNKLRTLPGVYGVSQSRLLTSVGNAWGGFLKYKSQQDSALVLLNIVDEQYIPLHRYTLVAGSNFVARPVTKEATSEIIVNEKTVRKFGIGNGNPLKAIGEEVLLDNRRLTIVGVIRDFHYGKLDSRIEPVVFTYLAPDAFLTSDGRDGLVNVRIDPDNIAKTMAQIDLIWRSIDPVHPLDAKFYQESIEEAYSEFSAMIRIVGLLSIIAISIASLGLLGMVVYSTENRIREICIRKIHGASSWKMIFLLSKGFILMIGIAALIALPLTYIGFERFILLNYPYHEAVGIAELACGFIVVAIIAMMMIGTQTIRAANSNPAEVLKNE